MHLHLIFLPSPWLGCMNHPSTELVSLPISRSRICFCPASSERIHRKPRVNPWSLFLHKIRCIWLASLSVPSLFPLTTFTCSSRAHFLISLIPIAVYPKQTRSRGRTAGGWNPSLGKRDLLWLEGWHCILFASSSGAGLSKDSAELANKVLLSALASLGEQRSK